jgi:hypothetical protein
VARAQARPTKDDWLPISQEDLAMKDNPASPGVHAMILYRESKVDSIDSTDREYYRIKIFTQEGAKRGNVELQFVSGFDEIKDLRARTIRPDGSIVNFEGKPYDKLVVKASGLKVLAKTFTLPDVKPGCIIEYKYLDQYDSSLYINMKWNVQGDLFTRQARFSIKPASGYMGLMYRAFGLPPQVVPQRQTDGTYALEVRDLPGLEEEELMPPEESLRANVGFYYRAKDETPEVFWKRIGKEWSDQLDRFVNKKGALEGELGRTVNSNDPPETKLRKIYARVQKIRNRSHEESKTEKEEKQEKLKENSNVEDVLKHGYGYGREINYLFVGLVRAAGFEATEAYMAGRNFYFFQPDLMNTDQVRADVVWVRAGGQEYYLDPASQEYPFGQLPWFETATDGLQVEKQGGKFMSTPRPEPSAATIVRRADLTLSGDGTLAGRVQVDFTGQEGAIRRVENRHEDETGRRKAIEDEIQGSLPSGAKFQLMSLSNWDNTNEPLRAEGTIQAPEFGTAAGRRILMPVTLFLAGQAKAFRPERRINNIYIHFPYEELDDVKVHLPAGYKAESMPPAQDIHPGAVVYEITATQQGETVEMKRHLAVNGIMFPAGAYPALRTFFNLVKSSDDAQIVLQNAPAQNQ